MLSAIAKLIKSLGANTNPGEIAHAMACGMILGLMPKNNLMWYLVMVFILFVRINKPMYVIMMLAGSVIAPACDGFFDTIGYSFLTIPQFSGFFGTLLDIPFVAFSKFNNSVVMGAFLCGLALYIPLYVLSRGLVALFRKTVVPALRKAKLTKIINQIPLVAKIAGLMGEE